MHVPVGFLEVPTPSEKWPLHSAFEMLNVCRMAFGGAEGYAGANGSSLEIRMERIMPANIFRPSRLPRAAMVALVAIAALFPLAGGYLKAQPQQAAGGQESSRQVQARNLFEQGKALMERKDYEEAERAFRRSYELDPDTSRGGLMGVVEVELALGRPDEALALLTQEAARRPEQLDLQLALGNTAVRAGKYDLALTEYQKLLNSLGNNARPRADVYQRIGEVYRRTGDSANAIFNLRMALEIQPQNLVATSALALELDHAGQAGEAEQMYRKALALDPHNAVALNNLAFLLAHGGDLEEALAFAQQARELLPEMPEVIDTIGYIYLARKSGDEAFGAFREAVLRDATNRTFRDHLAEAIDLKGDRSSTAQALKVALRAEPDDANRELVKKLLQ
jgi:Flp pilus assembly protein TadD